MTWCLFVQNLAEAVYKSAHSIVMRGSLSYLLWL